MDSTERPVKIPPEFAIYAEKHGIFELYKRMLAELITNRPDDPLKYMIEYLKRKNDNVPQITILGPPISGKKSIGCMISKELDTLLLTPQNILNSSESYLRMAGLSPDDSISPQIWADMVKQRLSSSDAVEKGWVLIGLPSNREMQIEFVEQGIFSRHYVVLEGPDSVLIERSAGKRVDPTTGDVYHVDFDWPTDEEVADRLVPVTNLTKESVARSLVDYYRSMDGVVARLGPYSKIVNVDMPKLDVYSQVMGYVCQPARTCAPRTPRIILIGPPGSGKSLLVEELQKQYNIVGVSVDRLVQEAVVSESEVGLKCKAYLDKNENIPDKVTFELIKSRLTALDCATCGWVLYDYPRDRAQACRLQCAHFIPNRVFLLDISDQSVEERLTLRSTDPVTGVQHHAIYHPPTTTAVMDRLQVHPRDRQQAVRDRLAAYRSRVTQLEEFYANKLQYINADQDLHTVFETIESMLVNPLPTCLSQ